MNAHHARIALVRELVKKPRSEVVLQSKFREVVVEESAQLAFADVNRLIAKMEPIVLLENPIESIIHGLAKSTPVRANKLPGHALRELENALSKIHLESLSETCIHKLAYILSVHGLSKPQLETLWPFFEKRVTDVTTLIGLVRKHRRFSAFVWDMYVGMNAKVDSPRLTSLMATTSAVNGWDENRLKYILLRRDFSAKWVLGRTVSHFIKALCHRPSEPKLGDQVWQLVELAKVGIKDPHVAGAVIEFYLVNEQWTNVADLCIETAELSPQLVGKILARCGDERFFSMLDILKAQVTAEIANPAVDRALARKSPRFLLDVLELIYVRSLGLDPIQRGKINDVLDMLPSRAKKRVTAVLELIENKSARSFIQ